MKSFAIEIMKIIAAIQRYVDKHGNIDAINKYYQTYGTYSGIVEYLNDIEKQEQKIQ